MAAGMLFKLLQLEIAYRLYQRKGLTEGRGSVGFRKLAALFATLVCVACFLCACSSSQPASPDDSRTTLVVGSDNYPPYNYLDENGNPTGIDVDIFTEALNRMGYNVEFKYINWEEKDSLLASGEIDLVAGSFTMTGRESLYRWAGPYMQSRQVVAVSSESDIYTLADLEGKVVAVQSTTRPEALLLNKSDSRIPQLKNLFTIDDRLELYPALSKGYVDAIAAHEVSIKQYEQDYGMSYRILDESLLDVGLGAAFYKDDDRGIAERLDNMLSEMHADGSLERIIGKYLDDPAKCLGVDARDA